MVDRCYRWVWCRKTMPPLVQMQKEGKNMADVRRELGVRSIRWKIEKRVLERIGHVMRMDDGRMTKVAVLGWLGELESWPKPKGRRRRTIFYWKKLLREAGVDATNLKAVTEDRKKWKKIVKERMEHLDKWEKSRGHKWMGEEMMRNEIKEVEVLFFCEVCWKRCKTKGGLVVHRRRMHEVSTKKRVFECEKGCGETFKQEANKWNHEKVCGGAVTDKDRRKCACGREFAKSYIARHRKKCVAAIRREEEEERRGPKKYKGKRKMCVCGREMAATNYARHKREACPYGEEGP